MMLIKKILPIFILCFSPINIPSQQGNMSGSLIFEKLNINEDLPRANIYSKLSLDSLVALDSLIFKTISEEQKYKYSYDVDGNLTFELFQKWDGIKWVNFKNWTYSYDSDGNVISELRKSWKDNNWINSSQTNFTYNSNKDMLSYILQEWSDSQWVNNFKRTNTYNSNRNLIFILYERWSDYQWTYSAHETYYYDINGKLILHLKEQPPISSKWVYKERFTYSYDSLGFNVSFKSESMTPELDEWLNGAQYIYNYDSTGKMSSYVYESWGGDQWEKETRSQNIYGSNGKISNVLIDTWRDELWTLLGRVTYTYDLNENMTFALAEEWYNDNWIAWSYILDFTDSFGREYDFFGREINVFYSTITDVKEEDVIMSEYLLMQNYPNPFNPITTISYSIPRSGFVKLNVYNLLGEEISNLVNEEKMVGSYKVDFNASSLTSGVYFYTLQTDDFVETRKLILLK
ncbi:MAG: T9SS type A sorting domain-containing protein [Erysipelotrichaceae bacterium]|nr:T9SS type A sorting domain-containing protein [Erysipelotrichaceae bacterium]